MTPENFTYWLQGFAELHQEPPTLEQWKSIKEHLALVFKKETPPVDLNIQEELNKTKELLASILGRQEESLNKLQEEIARKTEAAIRLPLHNGPQLTC